MVEFLEYCGYTGYEIDQYMYFHNICNYKMGNSLSEVIERAVSSLDELSFSSNTLD